MAFDTGHQIRAIRKALKTWDLVRGQGHSIDIEAVFVQKVIDEAKKLEEAAFICRDCAHCERELAPPYDKRKLDPADPDAGNRARLCGDCCKAWEKNRAASTAAMQDEIPW